VIYLDTSFIAPYYLLEATSDRIERLLTTPEAESFAVSHWTQVEFASLLARKVRMAELDSAQAKVILSAFEVDCAVFSLLPPTTPDFELASKLLLQEQTGLRAGDALHLSIAHRRGLEIFSLDKGLIAAAHTLNIRASDGGINYP
jgi:uncharacterized protein